jgi:Arc/MetJ-type ribon-helix-helix transcriptional regulator
MSKPKTAKKVTIRLTCDEEQQLKAGVRRRGYATTSALIRDSIWKVLGEREEAESDAEQRMAATLERLERDIRRAVRGQQALFAVVDSLVKTFLTCVPEPPQDGLPQSVARARDRYARFVKSAGQAMVGDSQTAMQDLMNHAD